MGRQINECPKAIIAKTYPAEGSRWDVLGSRPYMAHFMSGAPYPAPLGCYAPAASLRAYVVSRKGCGRLLKLTESLRAPIDLTVHELCVNGDLIALTARTSLLMESSIIKVAASSEDLPSNIDHTPPWSPDLL